jgi:acyl carrier protein
VTGQRDAAVAGGRRTAEHVVGLEQGSGPGARPAGGARAATTGGALDAIATRRLVGEILLDIMPDADIAALPPDADLRAALELDPLDVLEMIEKLGQRTGCRIEEGDYEQLQTLAGITRFLSARTSRV